MKNPARATGLSALLSASSQPGTVPAAEQVLTAGHVQGVGIHGEPNRLNNVKQKQVMGEVLHLI